MFNQHFHEHLCKCLFDKTLPFKLEDKEEFNSEFGLKCIGACEVVLIYAKCDVPSVVA